MEYTAKSFLQRLLAQVAVTKWNYQVLIIRTNSQLKAASSVTALTQVSDWYLTQVQLKSSTKNSKALLSSKRQAKITDATAFRIENDCDRKEQSFFLKQKTPEPTKPPEPTEPKVALAQIPSIQHAQ